VSTHKLGGLFSSRQLVEMASSVPARVAHIDDKTGTIVPGMYADFFLVHSGKGDVLGERYDAIVAHNIGNISLVVIDGVPIYGDPGMLRSLHVATEPLHLCGIEKALNSAALPNGPFAQVEARLKVKMKALGTELGPLDSCAK
jgi:hypothetical protein